MSVTVRGISTERREGSVGDASKREYIVTYLVHTTDFDDGPQQIIDSPDIPNRGDPYNVGTDSDPFAFVTDISVTQRESPDEWEVQVRYGTLTYSGDAQISASTRSRSVVISGRFQDPRNASPDVGFDLGVHNSAGQHFDPPPMIDIDEPIINIKKNVKVVDWPFILSITNAVNEYTFFGCPPRTLKFSTPAIESAVDSEMGAYWILTYSLVYKFDTWDVQVLNRGTWYIYKDATAPSDNYPKKFENPDDGTNFYGLLKIDGTPLNEDSDLGRWMGIYKPDGTGDPPTFQRFRVYREVDFNTLGIL